MAIYKNSGSWLSNKVLLFSLFLVSFLCFAQQPAHTQSIKKANEGDVKAMKSVALDYFYGRNGVETNVSLALEYAQKASDAGDAIGAFMVGSFAANERINDYERSCKYLALASDRGHEISHIYAGRCVKELKNKILYFTRAHEVGNEQGSYNLVKALERDDKQLKYRRKILENLLRSKDEKIKTYSQKQYASSFLTPALHFDVERALAVFDQPELSVNESEWLFKQSNLKDYAVDFPKEVFLAITELARHGSLSALSEISRCVLNKNSYIVDDIKPVPFNSEDYVQFVVKEQNRCIAMAAWLPDYDRIYIENIVVPAVVNSFGFFSGTYEETDLSSFDYTTRLLKNQKINYDYSPSILIEFEAREFFDVVNKLEKHKREYRDNQRLIEIYEGTYNVGLVNIAEKVSEFIFDKKQIYFPMRSSQNTLKLIEKILSFEPTSKNFDKDHINRITVAKRKSRASLFEIYSMLLHTTVLDKSELKFVEERLVRYRKEAEESSYRLSQHGYLELAERYRLGKGVDKDLHVAKHYYSNAFNQGSAYAAAMAGAIFESEGDYDSAIGYYQQAVSKGYSNASSALARAKANKPSPQKEQWQIIRDVMLDDRNIRSAFEEYDMVRNYCSNFNNYQVRDEWANTYRCKRYDACMSIAESLIDKKNDDKDRMCNAKSSIKKAIYSAFSGQSTSDVDLAFQEADSSIKGNYQTFKSAFPYLKVDFNKIGKKMEREEAQARSQAAWASLMRKIEDVPNSIQRDLASAERAIQQASGIRSALTQPHSIRNIESTTSNISSDLRQSNASAQVTRLTNLTLTNESTSQRKLSFDEIASEFNTATNGIQGTGNLGPSNDILFTFDGSCYKDLEANRKKCEASFSGFELVSCSNNPTYSAACKAYMQKMSTSGKPSKSIAK